MTDETKTIVHKTELEVKGITPYHKEKMDDMILKKSIGVNPYPHECEISLSLSNFVEKYKDIAPEAKLVKIEESIAGRVTLIRGAGKLIFMTLESSGKHVQLMFNISLVVLPDDVTFKEHIKNISRGDIINVFGHPAKTHTGELSILVRRYNILSPCLHEMPKSHNGLKDPYLRVTQRYLDMIVNPESYKTFVTRTKVINSLRHYLDDNGYIEVTTPILNTKAGGANAKPFATYHNDLKMDMVLRIAPELFLKMLVVGGMERVYEIGQQFRNESADHTHNPEFTSCEFYTAYSDYYDMMNMCESLFPHIVYKTLGKLKITYTPCNSEDIEIDFTPPYKRLDMVEEIEKGIGMKLPEDLGTDESRVILDELCVSHKIDCSFPRTNARLLDKLCGHFVESQCINPTFIMNHPRIMSPLAKWHRDKPFLSERFELFINKTEYCNAYTELNDPVVQKEAFEKQLKDKKNGDDEAQDVDETFLKSLEYGLPPTAGFGIGIDRLIMLLTNKYEIFDVILFPTYKEQK